MEEEKILFKIIASLCNLTLEDLFCCILVGIRQERSMFVWSFPCPLSEVQNLLPSLLPLFLFFSTLSILHQALLHVEIRPEELRCSFGLVPGRGL